MTLLHSGWGIFFLDYDNDGYNWTSLVTQGHEPGYGRAGTNPAGAL